MIEKFYHTHIANEYYINGVKKGTKHYKQPANEFARFTFRSSRFNSGFIESKEDKELKRRASFIGDFKKQMRLKPENRNKNQFHRACKRVYQNPFILANEQI
jgi:hypothetical protein